MTIEEIFALKDFAAIKYELTKKVAPNVASDVCIKQFDPTKHGVFDEAIRPKKIVKKAPKAAKKIAASTAAEETKSV
jgi:hypothetical protein